jgi:hypothetical protein
MKSNSRRILLVTVASALAVCVLLAPEPPRADSATTSELTFLTLEISDQGITLVEWNTVPGTIKRPRRSDERTGIVYEVQSVAGGVLWRGALDDPRIVRLESYDPSPSGKITGQFIRRETAQFTIRVPREVSVHRIAFFSQSRSEKAGFPSVTQTPLSTIDWPSTRQGRRP